MQDFVQVFGNGFFPIIMCAVLFWYVIQQDSKHKEEINALRESMDQNNRNFIITLNEVKDAISALREALIHDHND